MEIYSAFPSQGLETCAAGAQRLSAGASVGRRWCAPPPPGRDAELSEA